MLGTKEKRSLCHGPVTCLTCPQQTATFTHCCCWDQSLGQLPSIIYAVISPELFWGWPFLIHSDTAELTYTRVHHNTSSCVLMVVITYDDTTW